MHNKYFTLLIATIFALLLASCGRGSDETYQPPDAPGQYVLEGWPADHIIIAGSGTLAAENGATATGTWSFTDDITIANTKAIQASNVDNNYLSIKARDSGVGLVTVAAALGAADPYFSTGGGSGTTFKFKYSGVADFGNGPVSKFTLGGTMNASTYHITYTERAAVGSPAANTCTVYARDTGGKTELVVVFPTGPAQQIAIEP